jgi:hypothetical protein
MKPFKGMYVWQEYNAWYLYTCTISGSIEFENIILLMLEMCDVILQVVNIMHKLVKTINGMSVYSLYYGSP